MNNTKALIALITLLLSFKSIAQPSPCIGKSLIVIENVSGLGKDSVTEMYFARICYTDPEHSKMLGQKPKWLDCFQNDSLVTDRLYLFSVSNSNCSHGMVASKTSGRFYLIGAEVYNSILVIKSNKRTMYIVMPDLGNLSVNTLYGELTVGELQKQNTRPETKPFYTPYLFLPTIEFKEGVYFLDDFSAPQEVKRFSTSDVIEFYDIAGETNRVSPKEYWNDEIGFYAPYGTTKVTYRRMLAGAINEKDAIRQIILNSPQLVREILNYAYWYKYIHKGTSNPGDKELQQIWVDTKKTSAERFEELSHSYKEGLMPKEEFVTNWEKFTSSHLQTMLEQDVELALTFIHYLLLSKEEITEFQTLIAKDTYQLDKTHLTEFLETQRIEK